MRRVIARTFAWRHRNYDVVIMTRALLVLAFVSSAFGATNPPASFTAPCHSAAADFTLQFRSASGDAMEDDMSVVLEREDHARIVLPIERSLFIARETMLNVKNVCQQVVGLEVRGDRVLLFFTWSGRPTWDHLALALVDVKAMRVLDVQNDAGTIKGEDGPLVLRKVSDAAYDMRLIRETLADSGCDCAESDIEEWMRISVKNDKIVTRWEK